MQEVRQRCNRNTALSGACMGGSVLTGVSMSTELCTGATIPLVIAAGMGAGAVVGRVASNCYYDRYLAPTYRDVGTGLVVRRLPPGFHRDEHFDRSVLRYARGIHAANVQYHAGGGNPSRTVRPPFRLPRHVLDIIESRIPRHIIEQEDELVRQAASGGGKEDEFKEDD